MALRDLMDLCERVAKAFRAFDLASMTDHEVAELLRLTSTEDAGRSRPLLYVIANSPRVAPEEPGRVPQIVRDEPN